MSHAEGSDRATATLVSRWDVSASPTDWTYKTQVPMTLVDGTWQVSWTPGVVAPQLTADETLDVARKWPQRADIVDSAGGKIMTEREVAAVGIDKTRVSGRRPPPPRRRWRPSSASTPPVSPRRSGRRDPRPSSRA